MDVEDPNETMSLSEAAERYGRSRQTLHSARQRGRLQVSRVGNQYQVTHAQMRDYLATMSDGWKLRNRRMGMPMATADDEPQLRVTVDNLADGSVWQVEVARRAGDPPYVATCRRLKPPSEEVRTYLHETMLDALQQPLEWMLDDHE